MNLHYLTILLLLSACTPHMMMDHPQITSEETFIAEMLPHHQEAVDTSRLMLDSEDAAVRALAGQIIDAQVGEIAMMEGWKREWYPSSTYTATYQNMMPDLNALSGKERDVAYLTGMIEHHQHAVEMARQAQTMTLRAEVRTLTENIITTQEKEIALMRELLA